LRLVLVAQCIGFRLLSSRPFPLALVRRITWWTVAARPVPLPSVSISDTSAAFACLSYLSLGVVPSDTQGTLNVRNSTFVGNSADKGGAIWCGILTL
jgi:predicted outer membrane repeat protein